MIAVVVDFVSWWLWRRWRIYCPARRIDHLFDQNRRLVFTPKGMMEFPSREEFDSALFHYDEGFVGPCQFNEQNCGGYRGKWTPKISFLGMDFNEDR
jgi:hypothetical protein